MFTKLRQFSDGFIPGYTSILLSFTLGALSYFTYFTGYLDTPLKAFPNRSIGIVVLTGIDANFRTLQYCLLIVAVILLVYGSFVLFSSLDQKVRRLLRKPDVIAEQSIQFYLAVFSLFLLFYAVYTGELKILDQVKTLLLCIGFIYYLSFLKVFTFRRFPVVFSYLKDYSVVTVSFILSFGLLFAGWSLGINAMSFTWPYLLFYFLFNFLFITLYPFVLAWLDVNQDRVRSANLMATIPLVLIPASIPLLNELQFAFPGIFGTNPERLARGMVGGFFAAGILFYLFFYFRPAGFKASSLIRNFIFPAILCGFFLFGAIDGFINYQTFDLFHNGERMLITQQLFSFGRIPFVDIIPTHGIMDFFGQALYSGMNGFRGTEMFLWRWIPVMLGMLLLYFILARMVSPFFGFLFILIAPEALLVHSNYRMCIAVALIILWVAHRPDFRRYLVLWISVILLFFWRYDFGVMAVIASFCIVPGAYFIHSKKELSWKTLLNAYRPAVVTFGIVFFSSLLLFSLVILMNGENPALLLKQFYLYFKIQIPTQTMVVVFKDYSVLVFLEYVVTPMISVLYILYYLYYLLFRKITFNSGQLIMAWLALFTLILSMRMIQRHTIMEGFNPVYSIFLLSSFPFYIIGRGKRTAVILFLLTFLIYSMLLDNQQEKVFAKTQPANLIPKGQFYQFYAIPRAESRAVIPDSSQFKNFHIFCDTYLKSDQTFFDFSNAPLLYVFTNRLFPAHIIPNLYHAADPVQDFLVARLDNYLKNGQMPFVLFKQNSVWDSVDGVPQPVRSYRVAEYIYRNFKPFANVDNYEIWKDKGSEIVLKESQTISPEFNQQADFVLTDVKIRDISGDSIRMSATGKDPFLYNVLNLGDGVPADPAKTMNLSLKFSSNKAGLMQIFYSMNGSAFSEKLSCKINVRNEPGIQEQTVSLTGIKRSGLLTGFRFDPPTGADFCLYKPTLTLANFLPRERTAPQSFDLKKLPYIWANYDEKEASTKTEILADYTLNHETAGPLESRMVKISSDVDKSQGNYLHLFISSKDSGQVVISYGNRFPSTFKFDLVPSGNVEQYLVRVSSQWAWMNDPIDRITLQASVPVTYKRMVIRKGD